MSEGMKSPRDILVAGSSFLLGMVFCYFLTAAKFGEPERGFMMVVHGPGAVNTNSLEALKLNWN